MKLDNSYYLVYIIGEYNNKKWRELSKYTKW